MILHELCQLFLSVFIFVSCSLGEIGNMRLRRQELLLRSPHVLLAAVHAPPCAVALEAPMPRRN
eukprot:6065562-Pleurochrysis_carterae.AAC.1